LWILARFAAALNAGAVPGQKGKPSLPTVTYWEGLADMMPLNDQSAAQFAAGGLVCRVGRKR